ncbi:LysR family transcriptional regulator [Sphingomonas psychrotolerans]|uniref:LysR family transcriptional regulator n=1 Tax=Sphingomonas psychrotolerans TaxID=1327635 RepID=A0A2K8M9Y7_9SPHN|nr:LysR family transcriptional regulator [Sphingomonas psychrotolerans]ATY30708.1 LysR family transcriptional regulator [Sphingomonas psychrotolerans]
MRRETMADLVAFLAVARERSFTRAAAQIGVSPSALSHTIRKLEERLGVRLLTRTSRSVSPTQAGQRLLERVGPHFDEVGIELDGLSELRDKPAGTIRITAGDHPAETILTPQLARLLPLYPSLGIEISVNNGFVDIAADGFDAGIRLGETLAQDMLAVRIGPELRMAVVGSPAYLSGKDVPREPGDLSAHACIGLRFPTHGGVAVWDLEKDSRSVNVRVEPRFIVNDMRLQRLAALEGAGLTYIMEDYVLSDLASGSLVRVLGDWCPPFPGYHLYYPSRRQRSPALAAVIDILRYRD